MIAHLSVRQILIHFLILCSVVCSKSFIAEDAVSQATYLLQSVATSSGHSTPAQQQGFSYYARELFSILFLNGPPTTKVEHLPQSELLRNAVQLLEQAAEEDNADALFMLAEMNFFGNYTHTRNYTEAFKRYEKLASLTGNSSAQHMVGFMYATGIGGAVPQDQARAMLYYTFAAEAGDIRSEMAVGYRYHSGIATPRNCDEAVHYYKKVSDKAMAYLRSGPPGNHMIIKEAYRIADDNGGVYGEGASVSSAGMNAKVGGPSSDAHASFEDVIEYLDLMSRKGDIKATFSLAKLHYDGSRGMKRDLRLARQHFLEVARQAWPKKGRPRSDISSSTEKLASKAAGFLGRMFLRGEGVKQDFELAQIWFKRGVSNGDALSQYSMGLIYLHGLGVPQDAFKAAEYLSPAADQDLASAQVRLGVLFLDQGDKDTAVRYFDLAARNGHIEAYYYLAELSYQGIGRDQNCPIASAYYKIVAEKAEVIVASFKEANEAYTSGDMEIALTDYMLAAEQGFEHAQANVAYILDNSISRLSLTSFSAKSMRERVSRMASDVSLALLYWTRSAKQANIDSLIKMGDYYLGGVGTHADSEKAASCYQAAAETLHSAQAYWNLGWMHENGIGIDQDFHLAKRFYDHALETNKEAYLPVTLALFKLRARSAWNRWTGGGIKSIQDEPVVRKSWSEWLTAFLEADAALYRDADTGDDQQTLLDDRDDWYNAPGGPGEGYEDMDFEDGLLESVLIIGAAALLMVLVMYRRRRREEEERRRQAHANRPVVPHPDEEEGGLFPHPADVNFMGWVAGGIAN